MVPELNWCVENVGSEGQRTAVGSMFHARVGMILKHCQSVVANFGDDKQSRNGETFLFSKIFVIDSTQTQNNWRFKIKF